MTDDLNTARSNPLPPARPHHAYARISDMLMAAGTADSVLPPTVLFNEGWMMRLVLDLYSRIAPSGHPLDFQPGASWRSEARLRSQFEPLTRGDALAESMTHADGVIGHLAPGSGRGDVLPHREATQFVVVEAKMWSGLSAGTTRAKAFNQAARNVACIAESIARCGCTLDSMSRVGFVLIAPESQIAGRVFFDWCDKLHIERVVRDRVAGFAGRPDVTQKEMWLTNHFLPILGAMRIDLLSWESVIASISEAVPEVASDLQSFYGCCIKHNRPAWRTSGSA